MGSLIIKNNYKFLFAEIHMHVHWNMYCVSTQTKFNSPKLVQTWTLKPFPVIFRLWLYFDELSFEVKVCMMFFNANITRMKASHKLFFIFSRTHPAMFVSTVPKGFLGVRPDVGIVMSSPCHRGTLVTSVLNHVPRVRSDVWNVISSSWSSNGGSGTGRKK